MKDADALLESVAAWLHQIPLGEAPIDRVIERLARENKLKKVGLYKLTLVEVRQRVIQAWRRALFATAKQTREERAQEVVGPSKVYRKHLSRLVAALAKFERDDRHCAGSPLDFRAALGDPAATELVDELRECVTAAARAANRVSKALAILEREYGGRGRPGGPLLPFAKGLALLWHDLTGTPPSVTHDPLEDVWVGAFVDFVGAAAAAVNQPELSGNLAVTADKAAFWYRRKLRRRQK